MTPQPAGSRDPDEGGIVTIGETMGLVSQTSAGALSHHRGMTLTIGGAESNVAIGVVRLGGTARWIGRVGADAIGDLIVRELRAEGVDSTVIRDGAPTGLMIKTRRTGNTSRVMYYRSGSAGSHLEPDDLDETAIQGAKVLHVTGITPALSDTASAAVFAAIETAQAAGALVSFDVNYRSSLWLARGRLDDAIRTFRDIAAHADLVFAGADEAALLVGGREPRSSDDPRALAAEIALLGPSQVVIKLGEHGCTALIDDAWLSEPAVRVPVVDTVGAGDAFVAGYLADLLRSASPQKRLTTATASGAFVVTVTGDWEGLPTRSELDLLARDEPVIR